MLNLPPNPKWDIARVSNSTLVNADCFDIFPLIADKSVDAIIADLPYGTTQNKWDSVLPLDELWEQYKRILKPRGVVLLFAQIPF
ncbi:MAG: class I SAM-dependent methyltransferase, partial [Bacteroidetes bacterium]|nr:class I SAM-dependent methyltransferase [Bacteroidota bacterium]